MYALFFVFVFYTKNLHKNLLITSPPFILKIGNWNFAPTHGHSFLLTSAKSSPKPELTRGNANMILTEVVKPNPWNPLWAALPSCPSLPGQVIPSATLLLVPSFRSQSSAPTGGNTGSWESLSLSKTS